MKTQGFECGLRKFRLNSVKIDVLFYPRCRVLMTTRMISCREDTATGMDFFNLNSLSPLSCPHDNAHDQLP